jgi:hypothetical protein
MLPAGMQCPVRSASPVVAPGDIVDPSAAGNIPHAPFFPIKPLKPFAGEGFILSLILTAQEETGSPVSSRVIPRRIC